MIRAATSQAATIVLAGALCAGAAFLASRVGAEPKAAVPNFGLESTSGWLPVGDELLPPPSGPGPVTFDKRYPYVDNRTAARTGQQPTFRVADLTNPILQPWAVEEMRKANAQVLAGKVPFRPRESCYPGGVPGFLVYNLVSTQHFLQTDKEITIINPDGPEVRRIYMNVPHSAHVTPSWYGESVGHYEGDDTLVADTIGLSTKAYVDNYRTPHTDRLHVVERFHLIDDGKMMEVLIQVDDPGAFTMPWSAMQLFSRQQHGAMSESICAENNFNPFSSFDVYPIPEAARADF